MTGSQENDVHADTHPIEGLTGLTHSQLETLKSRWVTTIEALVAILATKMGQSNISRALGIDKPEIEALLDHAREIVGEDRYAELMIARPGGPTGALIQNEDMPDFPEAGDTEE